VCRIPHQDFDREQSGRKAGCSMHRDALGGRMNSCFRVVAVVGRSRRGSCLRCMGYFLPNTTFCQRLICADAVTSPKCRNSPQAGP
jgi:hypothetical protein